MEEDGQEEGVGTAIGEYRIYLDVDGNGLVGLYASCDHEIGEEAGMGGDHGVGDETTSEVVASKFVLPR
jgi:hypothetical protein